MAVVAPANPWENRSDYLRAVAALGDWGLRRQADVDIHVHAVDSLLTHLRDAGKLEQAAGIAVGDTKGKHSGTLPELSMEDVLEELLAPQGMPVIYGLPFGHGKRHATVPIGAEAVLDADAGRLTVTEVVTPD